MDVYVLSVEKGGSRANVCVSSSRNTAITWAEILANHSLPLDRWKYEERACLLGDMVRELHCADGDANYVVEQHPVRI